MTWHINQNPLWGKRQRRKKKRNLNVQRLTCDTNLDTFITCTVPISVLIQTHIYEGSNNGECEHGRAATKAGEMKYFTLSPGFPLRLKSSALPSFTGSAQLQLVLPWERARMEMCARSRAHAYTWQKKKQKQRRNKIPKKGEKKQDLGCLWVCFTPTLFCFAPPLPPFPPWQGTGRLEQQSECDVTLCWALYSARLLLICKLT